MAVFAILMSVNFAACSDDGDGGSNPLVGTWTTDWDRGYGTVIYSFNSDGTYSWNVGVYESGNGYYSFNYPQLTLSESGGSTSLWTIVSMEKNYFVIMTKSAATYTFTKSEGVNNVQDVSGTVQGHDYVDLGLSVKWATCNVGATAPEKEGSFYAWGETTTKKEYNWDNYKWSKKGDNWQLTKYFYDTEYDFYLVDINNVEYYWEFPYKDDLSTLLPSDDVASAKWGSSWRMPTRTEMEELITKCTWTWTMRNGYTGYEVTGRNGNSIFLPTIWTERNSWDERGYDGYYWTASLSENDYPVFAYNLEFSAIKIYGITSESRCEGFLVRPVTK